MVARVTWVRVRVRVRMSERVTREMGRVHTRVLEQPGLVEHKIDVHINLFVCLFVGVDCCPMI